MADHYVQSLQVNYHGHVKAGVAVGVALTLDAVPVNAHATAKADVAQTQPAWGAVNAHGTGKAGVAVLQGVPGLGFTVHAHGTGKPGVAVVFQYAVLVEANLHGHGKALVRAVSHITAAYTGRRHVHGQPGIPALTQTRPSGGQLYGTATFAPGIGAHTEKQ